MATKTIRVSEEVYYRLKARKRADESFSELLNRLVDRRSAFEQGFGALEDIDFESELEVLDDRMAESFGAG